MKIRNLDRYWEKGLQEKDLLRGMGSTIIAVEGAQLYMGTIDPQNPERHYLRRELFGLLLLHISNYDFSASEKQNFMSILDGMAFNSVEKRAIIEWFRRLSADDAKFIQEVTSQSIIDSVMNNSPVFSITEIVDNYFQTPQQRNAAIKYLKDRQRTQELEEIFSPEVIEMLDSYTKDEILRDRLITYIEVQSTT